MNGARRAQVNVQGPIDFADYADPIREVQDALIELI